MHLNEVGYETHTQLTMERRQSERWSQCDRNEEAAGRVEVQDAGALVHQTRLSFVFWFLENICIHLRFIHGTIHGSKRFIGIRLNADKLNDWSTVEQQRNTHIWHGWLSFVSFFLGFCLSRNSMSGGIDTELGTLNVFSYQDFMGFYSSFFEETVLWYLMQISKGEWIRGWHNRNSFFIQIFSRQRHALMWSFGW